MSHTLRTAGRGSLLALVLTATSAFAGLGDVAVHGIVSQGYLKSNHNNYLVESAEGSFSYFEMALNATAVVDHKTRVGAQLFARDLGHEGDNIFLVDWAFGDYRWRDELGFRVGKVKTPLGFYNKTRDIDMVRNPMFLPQSVYTEDFRDVANAFQGASAYGVLPVGDSASLEYEAFIGGVNMDTAGFIHDIFKQVAVGAPSLSYEAEMDDVYGGALVFNTPLEGLRVGATWLTGDMTAEASFATPAGALPLGMDLVINDYWTLSAEYTRDALLLAFEYQRMFTDITLKGIPFVHPVAGPMLVEITQTENRGGLYGQATYRVSDKVEIGGYYSKFRPDWNRSGLDDPATYMNDLALTVRYDATDYWVLKCEFHSMDGVGDLEELLNPDGTPEDKWSLFGAKSTFYF